MDNDLDKATLAAALDVFMDEARDLIADMEAILLRMDAGTSSGDDMHALFRCAHTIKGSAGMFGLEEVVRFTHVVESVLNRLRMGEISFSPELTSLLLESQDHIAGLIAAAASGSAADSLRSDAIIPQLDAWLDSKTTQQVHGPVSHPNETELSADGGGILSDYWHISLRFKPEVLTDGMDPLKFINYLNHFGQIVHVETISDLLPPLTEVDPERLYLGFEVALASTASKHEIENVFEFYGDNATITILPPHSKISEYLDLIGSMKQESPLLGEILVACGTLTRNELERALQAQRHAEGEPIPRLGDLLVESGVVSPAVVGAAVEKQQRDKEVRNNESKSLKVQADRLDALIDRVGELVIASSGNQVHAVKTAQPAMLEAASQLLALVEDIRDMALRLRMVAIGEVFSRFPRVVRDVSRELGKEIELQISGADAELDKSMVDKIADPLMHLLRNSMDHGIEPAAVREAQGKPAQGTVSLNAYHESGLIVIEVADDGAGLDLDKIRRKAIEKGIISESDHLTPSEIQQLILAPGFSTAERLTNLSGRGVGMDVVKSNVEALRGTLDIQSEFGRGTTMRLCLPLTLAIIDGFHVGIGDSHFIVPLDMVVECVELPEGLDNVDYMEQRGVALPFVRLRELFGANGPAHPRPRVVIVRFAGKRIGLVVDRIYGKYQTVIKPLGPLFRHVPCVTGSTILGDGEVALIMDINQLIQGVMVREAQRRRQGTSHGQAVQPA